MNGYNVAFSPGAGGTVNEDINGLSLSSLNLASFTGTLNLNNALTVTGATTITANSTLVNNADFTGALSNAGTFTNSATGTVSGLLTNTAGTTTNSGQLNGGASVSGGTLALSGSGSIAGAVADTATFDISQTTSGASITSITGSGTVALGAKTLTLTAASGIFSGVIQDGGIGGGTGGSLVNVGGYTTLTGNNSYTGTTTISSGTLQIGNVGTTGSLGSGAVVNNGVLAFYRTTAFTVANAISGTGQLDQLSSGTLTLTAANTYTGQTLIGSATTLALSGSGAIATSSVVNANTGTFDISQTAGASIRDLTGSGTVALGGQLLTITAAASTFSGVIQDGGIGAGTGGALTINGGTETLTGANTYTGATTISGGTLALSGSGSIATSSGVADNAAFDISATTAGASIKALTGSGTLALGSKALTITAGSGTYSGAISGSGSVTLSSGSETFSGANTYTGGTTISGSTLIAGNASAFGTGTVTLNGGTLQTGGNYTIANAVAINTSGGTINNGGNTITFSGVIADGNGSGALTSTGAGTLTLTNANTYTGATTIAAGWLALSGSGSIASSSSVTDNGVFDISQTTAGASITSLSGTNALNLGSKTLTLTNASGTYSGFIQDAGAGPGTGGKLTIAGGTETLTGTNTYTGATTINSGATLKIGNNTATGSLGSGAVTDNGLLAFALTSPTTLANVISGTGGLSQNGSGILTITAAEPFAGGVNISSGTTLALSGSGSLASATSLADNGIFDISATSGTSIRTLSGTNTGTVALGSQTLTITAGANFFAGAISGTGGNLAITGGSETLTGTNTYTGTTTIGSGALLQIGSNTANGSLGSGAVTDNGLLIYFRTSAATLGSVISGTGNLFQKGTGTLTLTGANTYTGTTTINSGATLALSGTGSVATSSGVAPTGTFDITQTTSGASITSLSGSGTAALGSKTLTITNAVGTFSGVIQDAGIGGGTGGNLVVSGGTEILSGANSYTGTTTISAGTLQIGNGGASGTLGTGAVTDNAALAFNRTDSVTVTNAISGTGSLTQAGSGALILTASNAYTGTTTINSGATLQIGSSGATGTAGTGVITDNGTLTYNHTDTVTLTSGIVGTGNITQAGSGTLILNNPVTFISPLSNTIDVGSYTINAGSTLQVGTGGTAGSLRSASVTDNGTLIFNQQGVTTPTTVIIGTGGVTYAGSGTLSIQNTQAYTGATTVSSGTLQIGAGGTTGSVAGNIVDNAAVSFNRSNSLTYAGVISGTGTLTQAGSGTLILNGVNTYTGGTTVSAGILEVGDAANATASILGPVAVASGGTLSGHGTIKGNVIVASGGTLQPGGTIGTITVNGNLTLSPGSTYTAEISPTAADQVVVTGTATLTGSNLVIVANPGTYTSTTYNFIQASSVTGTYASVTGTIPGGSGTITYSATGVTIGVVPTAATPAAPAPAAPAAAAPAVQTFFLFNTYGKTTNGINAGAALTAGANTGALYLATGNLVAANTAAVPGALGQLAGDIHASIRSASIEDSRLIRGAVLDRIGRDPDGVMLWATGFGGMGSISTNGNAGSLNHRDGGVIVGADMPLADTVRVGIAGAWTMSKATVTGHTSTANGSMGHIIAYAGFNPDAYDIRVGGEYGWGSDTVSRSVGALGLAATDHQSQQSGQLFANGGYKFSTEEAMVEPYLGIAAITATSGAFAETGSIAALSGTAKSDHQTYGTAGLRAALKDMTLGGMPLFPHADIGWQHAFNAFTPGQTATFQSSATSFTVVGVPLSVDAATVQLGFDLDVSPHAIFSFGYDGSFSSRVQNNAIRAAMDWKL
jgi:fibronectin-binding autotransporter adhesin